MAEKTKDNIALEDIKKSFKANSKLRILIVLLTIGVITLFFPKGEALESEVSVGTIWINDDLIASTNFEILKAPEDYAREQSIAASKVYPIFVIDREIETSSIDSITSYNRILTETIDYVLRYDERELKNPTFLTQPTYEGLKRIRLQENRIISQNRITLQRIFTLSNNLIRWVYRRGIINLAYSEIGRDTISIRDSKFETPKPVTNYYDDESLKISMDSYLKERIDDVEIVKIILEYVYHFIKPNLIYSQQLTDEAVILAKESVVNNEGTVKENERIVSKHDVITKLTKLKIDSYRKAKGSRVGFIYKLEQSVGKFIHILLVLIPFMIYIFLFRKKIFYDASKILLLSLIMLFISGLAFLVSLLEVNVPVQFLIIVPVAPMMLTIIFDSRIGFYSAVVIALIAGGLRGNDYIFTVMNIVAGGLAAYSVRDMKNRTQIFRSFTFILIGYVIGIIAFGLERFEAWDVMLIEASFATVNALISPAFAYGMIIFIEKIFRITTDLTLLELSDFNHPLLRDLAKRAPGTFTHSMTIGSIVESACDEIDANRILARVGAYYHDVGKALIPEQFVENQMDNINIHENLEPKESAKLIINHVTEGMRIAKENKLPKEIIDFIPTHHGTLLVTYFYEKAVQMYGKENVDISDFRYPGPKPYSKETALLMLADACESASRSIQDPDVQKVENMITNLFKQRINDGQLDDADLTLQDLTKIKKSFLNNLVGQHHKRIRYPNQEKMENASSDSTS